MVPLSTVAYLEFAKGGVQEVWGTEVPQWDPGVKPVQKAGQRGQKASASQKLTLFCYWMPKFWCFRRKN